MSNRYSKYSATLGGETFRWSVEGGLGPGAGERLTEMGIPIRVKFAFNFNRMALCSGSNYVKVCKGA